MRIGALLVLLGSLLVGTQVLAAGGRSDGDSIGAIADATVPRNSPPEPNEPQPDCHESDKLVNRTSVSESGGFIYRHIDQHHFRYSPATGESWVEMHEVCRWPDGRVRTRTYWQLLTTADPAVLASLAQAEVWEKVPAPTPVLSPVGPGYVNLGMWLAVAAEDPVSVTARAGSVSATTTATLVSTVFEMGNGDVVVCDGFGDPIPASALESVEPSPVCGYTYREVPPDEPYLITFSSTWTVSWVGTGGVGGVLEPIVRTSSVEYEVREIQTVGSG